MCALCCVTIFETNAKPKPFPFFLLDKVNFLSLIFSSSSHKSGCAEPGHSNNTSVDILVRIPPLLADPAKRRGGYSYKRLAYTKTTEVPLVRTVG